MNDLYGQDRQCPKECTYVSEILGISPDDFIIWNAGLEAFRNQVKKEKAFDIEVLGAGGIRTVNVDMSQHMPCKNCQDRIDFGIVFLRGRVEDGVFVRAKGKKGKLNCL